MVESMAHTAAEARTQLELALSRGIEFPFTRQTLKTAERKVRDSAVLVLFGALDRVHAATSGNGVSTVPPELDVLLTMRSNGLRNHAGQIAFPGGGVDLGDTGRAATALREANEETGLDPTGVDVLGLLPDAHIPVSNYNVTPVVGWWRLPSEVAADHSESIEVFRVPVAELIHPEARATSVLTREGMTFRGPAFRLGPQFGGHIVWGFTAMLLTGIFDSVGWSVPWDESRTVEVNPIR